MMTDQITLFVRNVDFASSVVIATNTDAGGKMEIRIRRSFAWVVGFFVALSPILYYFPHGIIWSLTHSIIGVGIAIAILKGWFSK